MIPRVNLEKLTTPQALYYYNTHAHYVFFFVNETTQLYFVSENIKAFTPTVAKTLNDQLSQYISFILNDEWAAMGTNRKSQKTQNEIERLYKTLLNYRPTDSTPLMYYEKAISSLESALSYRHERLHMTHVEIPIAWYVMIFLSAIITACVFSFENDSGRSYMHILLYVLLGFYLTAITILSYPFSGYATVSPQPFYDLLHTINGNYPPISGKLSPLN